MNGVDYILLNTKLYLFIERNRLQYTYIYYLLSEIFIGLPEY